MSPVELLTQSPRQSLRGMCGRPRWVAGNCQSPVWRPRGPDHCCCLPSFIVRPSGGAHSREAAHLFFETLQLPQPKCWDTRDHTGRPTRTQSSKAAGRAEALVFAFSCPAFCFAFCTCLTVCPRICPSGKWAGLSRKAGRWQCFLAPSFSEDPVLHVNLYLPVLPDTLPASAWPRPRRACDFILPRPGMPGMPGQQQRQQQQLDCQLGAGEAPRALFWGTGPRMRG